MKSSGTNPGEWKQPADLSELIRLNELSLTKMNRVCVQTVLSPPLHAVQY